MYLNIRCDGQIDQPPDMEHTSSTTHLQTQGFVPVLHCTFPFHRGNMADEKGNGTVQIEHPDRPRQHIN
jgi:hypothetical protein